MQWYPIKVIRYLRSLLALYSCHPQSPKRSLVHVMSVSSNHELGALFPSLVTYVFCKSWGCQPRPARLPAMHTVGFSPWPLLRPRAGPRKTRWVTLLLTIEYYFDIPAERDFTTLLIYGLWQQAKRSLYQSPEFLWIVYSIVPWLP